jgi:hypothetical protein
MTSAYPEFVASFLKDNPDHPSLPYAELHRRLIATRYGLSDFYARQMNRLGNDAAEVFASVEVLQRAWAREHGIDHDAKNWVNAIAAAQVEHLRPDVVFMQDLFLFDPVFRSRLRAVAPEHAVFVGWRSSPTSDFASFGDLDLVVSAFPHFVSRWRSLDINAHHLPLAFEPTILDEIGPVDRDLRFSFVGQIGASSGPHRDRKLLIEELVAATPLEVYGGLSMDPRSFRQRMAAAFSMRSIRGLRANPERYVIPARRLNPPVFGLDYYRVLGRSQVTLNHHSYQASGPHASNLRLYEATGMGACLVTDHKDDLGTYFDVGSEVVSYENEVDCAEKVRYLIDNPSEAEAIAAAGQLRTVTEHNYARRIEQLDGWLKGLLVGGRTTGAR